MTAIESMLQAGFLLREAEFGATMTWNGADYPCSPGSLSTAKKLAQGGNSLFDDLVIVIRLELLGDIMPKEFQNVDYKPSPDAAPRSLKIESVTFPPGLNYIELQCNARCQGA